MSQMSSKISKPSNELWITPNELLEGAVWLLFCAGVDLYIVPVFCRQCRLQDLKILYKSNQEKNVRGLDLDLPGLPLL